MRSSFNSTRSPGREASFSSELLSQKCVSNLLIIILLVKCPHVYDILIFVDLIFVKTYFIM